MSKREAALYIEDILTSIEKIENYTQNMSFEEFCNDYKTIDAVVRNLSIIGEAVNNIPEETKEKYPNISWRGAIGMRNKVVHEYFGVDEEILWKTIRENLPNLKKQILEMDRK